MQIDWFTFVAQIVNFLILVGLLKYFVYNPVVRAMDRREERIASRIEEADRKAEEAEQEKERFREKQSEMEDEKDRIFERARKDANARKDELVREIRVEVANLRRQWKDSLEQEKDSFLQDVRRQVARLTTHAVRRALKDLADRDLEKQTIEVFLNQLCSLAEDRVKEIAKALEKSDRPLRIRTAFDLSDDQRERIGKTVRERLHAQSEVQFESDTSLLCGIELKIDGRKIGWNLQDHIRSLADDLRDVLEQQARSLQRSEKKTETDEEEEDPPKQEKEETASSVMESQDRSDKKE